MADLTKIAHQLLKKPENDAVGYLVSLFEHMKMGEQKYSYRQFSKDLGFGFTNYLHLILTRKRKLSLKAAGAIVKRLLLRGAQKNQFMAMVRFGIVRTQIQRESALSEILEARSQQLSSHLDKAQVAYLSQWYHPVVREILLLPDSVHTSAWIAKHIFPSIDKQTIEESLNLLLEIGYISKKAGCDRYTVNDVHIRTPPEIAGISILKYHYEMITRAKEALTEVSAHERDVSAVTFSISSEDFSEVKSLVREFRKNILAISEKSKNANNIYQLNIQMFPFSRIEESK